MNSGQRTFITLLIWACVTGISITAMVNSVFMDPVFVMIICGVALGSAAITTTRIWSGEHAPVGETEKLKRQSRVDQILAKMSDSDLDELRARLMESDGESTSLEALLSQRERRSGR